MGRELMERLTRTPSSRGTQQSLKEGPQFVEQPCKQPLPSGANSGLGELIKQKLQPLGGRYRVLDQEIESFSAGLDTVLFVIFCIR